MLNINMADVMNIVNNCKPQLIFFAVVFVVAIITMIACLKLKKHTKYMIRRQAGVAILLGLIITVNAVLLGPLTTIVSLATGHGTISEKSSTQAKQLVETVADEGIVLMKNQNNALPLKKSTKLNVFGWASTNPCYGGTGSGSLSQSYHTVSLMEGLTNAGFSVNKDLENFYSKYRADRPVVGMFAQDWTLPEPAVSKYSDKLISDAKSYSDTAVVVISRVGGEGADLPKDMGKVTYKDNSKDYKDFPDGSNYLQLSQSEKSMLDLVCKNFSNVVVVYNGANAMELNFVNNYSQIKGLVWCPGTGQTGFNALGKILDGEVNPSGKTTDTFVKDLTKAPNYNNTGSFTYDNMSEYTAESFGVKTSPTFVDYNEGIYVGYRYYETAAAEGLINYDDQVLYPFGYGMSYTNFTQEMSPIKDDGNGNLSFDVKVTNTGSAAGKDVVEAYYNPPYTNGGTEKATANLVAFEKTKMLDAGASETVKISFTKEDMASYDSKVAKSYVLDAGNYAISINNDSHNVIASQTYTVSDKVVYGESNKRSTDSKAAENQFDYAAGDVTYLSRADKFANYDKATAAPSLTLAAQYKEKFINNSNYDPKKLDKSSDKMPTTGADNGIKLADLRGVSYNDKKWDKLLDELSFDDMNTLISTGGYQTKPISSVSKLATIDCDGPASINNNFTGVGSIGFPSAVMIAATWNKDIAKQFGESIGTMASEMGVSGWYAPAMNIHRSAFSGRNFEYYSEDGLLSGKMAANAINGAAKHGVYAYMKHFALNDQETNRCNMLCTWTNEQAMREIYLKPFELAVKEGKVRAVMSSFNYIGTVYAGGSSALLKSVLRDEWGFKGFVETDYFGGYGYQNADQLVRNGNDICLANYDAKVNNVTDKSATSVIAMRQSAKNIMYTVVNSRAYSEKAIADGNKIPEWKIILITADVLLAGVIILLEVVVIRKGYKKRKDQQ